MKSLRTRKVISYAALLGSDSDDDDFKQPAGSSSSSSSSKSRLSTKSRLKLKSSGGDKTTVLATVAVVPPAAEVLSLKVNPVECSEADLTVPEPDLNAHSIGSQETVILSPYELSFTSGLAEVAPIDAKPADAEEEVELGSRKIPLSSVKAKDSETSEWEEERTSRRKDKRSEKRKLSSSRKTNETKKIKVDPVAAPAIISVEEFKKQSSSPPLVTSEEGRNTLRSKSETVLKKTDSAAREAPKPSTASRRIKIADTPAAAAAVEPEKKSSKTSVANVVDETTANSKEPVLNDTVVIKGDSAAKETPKQCTTSRRKKMEDTPTASAAVEPEKKSSKTSIPFTADETTANTKEPVNKIILSAKPLAWNPPGSR